MIHIMLLTPKIANQWYLILLLLKVVCAHRVAILWSTSQPPRKNSYPFYPYISSILSPSSSILWIPQIPTSQPPFLTIIITTKTLEMSSSSILRTSKPSIQLLPSIQRLSVRHLSSSTNGAIKEDPQSSSSQTNPKSWILKWVSGIAIGSSFGALFYPFSSDDSINNNHNVSSSSSSSSSLSSVFDSIRGKSMLAFADWSPGPTEAASTSLDSAPNSLSLKNSRFLFPGMLNFTFSENWYLLDFGRILGLLWCFDLVMVDCVIRFGFLRKLSVYVEIVLIVINIECLTILFKWLLICFVCWIAIIGCNMWSFCLCFR